MDHQLTSSRDIFAVIGSYGPWQRKVTAIFFVIYLIGGYQNFVITFMAPDIRFWCVSSPIEENITRNSTIETKVLDFASQCEVHTNQTSHACDKWGYDTSEYTRTIVNEWDLVCDKEWLISFSKSIYMVGFMLSVMIFGHVSDWIGRFPTIVICYVIGSLSTLISAVSTSYTMFVVLRFLCAFGRCGMGTTGLVLLTEIVGPDRRINIFIVVVLGYCLGFVTLPGVAFLIRPWNWLQLAISLPMIPLVCCCWMIPESPRWLMTRGKTAKFVKVVSQAARENGRPVSEEEIEALLYQQKNKVEEGKTKTLFDLLKTPQLAKRTLYASIIWIINAFIYYALSFNTNSLGGNPYLNFFMAGVTECLAAILTFYCARFCGRKIILIVGMLICGGVCASLMVVPPDMHWLVVTFTMIGRLCIAATFSLLQLYTTEAFPTVVRNISIGTCSTFARIGSITAPFVQELENVTNSMVPPALNAGLAISGGLLAFLLPETKNKTIPDTMEEGEKFGETNSYSDSSEKAPLIKKPVISS